MKSLFLPLLLLIGLIALPAHAEESATLATSDTLHLYSGEVKILKVPEIERVAIGNGEVLSVTNLPGQLVLIGTTSGYTNLLLWTKKGGLLAYNVDVSGEHPQGVDMRPMVYLTVQVVDFRKSVLERIGIDWQQAAAGPVLGLVADVVHNPYYRIGDPQQGNLSSNTLRGPQGNINGLPTNIPGAGFVGITTSLSSVINLAVQNGDAYILASPQLSTRSGGAADFLAGGEVPIPITSALGQVSVQYKEYGIKLKIKPEADNRNNILASIETEVSQIDPSVTVNSYPGFLTRKTSSSVNVLSNQTVVLSGLMQASGAESVNRVPGLGRIPVLGKLFSSKDFQANRSELVIFVTPVVVMPYSNINTEAIEHATGRMREFNDGPGKEVYQPGFGTGPGSHLPPSGASAEEAEKISMKAVPTPLPAPAPQPYLLQVIPPPEAVKVMMMEAPGKILPNAQPMAKRPKPAMPQSGMAKPVNLKVVPVGVTGESAWGVQVCSNTELANAQACAKKLQDAALPGMVEPFKSAQWSGYLVRVGPMKTLAEAQAAQEKVKALGFKGTLVVKKSMATDAVVAKAEEMPTAVMPKEIIGRKTEAASTAAAASPSPAETTAAKP